MLSIEPFGWVVALLPLIGYLFLIGLIRFSGRALVTTGAREIAALAVAVCGFIAMGPAELFFPGTAASLFGPVVWLALGVFYMLVVTLYAITSEPKLVVHGRTPQEAYAPLLRAARRLDPEAEADEMHLHVFMPQTNVRLRIDGIRTIDYCRIVSFDPIRSPTFWHLLLSELRKEIASSATSNSRRGRGTLVVASLLSVWLLWQAFSNHAQLVEGFRNWLWR